MANPYQSPNTTKPIGDSKQIETDLVISGQRILIYSILGYLCSMPLMVSANAFLGGTSEEPVVTPMFSLFLVAGLLVLLAAAICASVGIFRMGKVLYPGSTRYLYAIGVLIPAPLLGLIVMFVANASAMGFLKARGIKVGFFGAKRR